MKDPNKFPPSITIQFEDTPIQCHQQNTWIYEFEEQNEQEHIFIDRSTRTRAKGIYLHKFEVVRRHNEQLYEKIKRQLGKIGVETIIEPYPSEQDTKVYQDKLKRYGLTASGLSVPEHALEPTPRQEAHIAYLHYLLETGQITPEDFEQEVIL